MKKARKQSLRPVSAAATGHVAASSVASVSCAPRVGNYTASATFFVLIAVLAYLAHAELGYNHGLFSEGVYEPYADFRAIPKAGGPSRVDSGREIYASAGCVACHQPGGTGNPANNCPPLAKSDWVLAEGPSRLIRLVLGGGQGPITVSGKLWNGGVMTAFGPNLTDDQVANVVTYIRQAPEWGNDASEVTPDMVKAIREKTASRTTAWTPDELLKLPVTE